MIKINELINIEGTNLQIKEFNGQRVVTFKDIDTAHERPEGTARKRFNDNKKRFIKGVDYYELNQPDEIRTLGIERPQGGTPQKVVLVTESGYLMIAKSLTDDLSWDVQRSLVDNYFRFKEQSIQVNELSPELQMFKQIFDTVARQEIRQNALEVRVDNTNQRIDSISDLIVLSPKNWRIESEKIIMMIAESRGGTQYIAVTRKEIYNAMDQRLGKRLFDRLKRRRRRMRINGATETAIKRLSILDIIETSNDSKTLIEGYLFILKETAIKYGVDKVIIENKPELTLVS